jgi:hypothetical protein
MLLIYPSANELNHAKPVGRTDPFVDNRVHALSHEMESKSTRTKLPGRKAFQRVWLRFYASIEQNNFQSWLRSVLPAQQTKLNLDRLSQLAAIGVANDVRDRFVHRERNRPAILFSETDRARNRGHRAPHSAKYLRIAQKLKPQKKLPPWQRRILQGTDCNGKKRVAAKPHTARKIETATKRAARPAAFYSLMYLYFLDGG